MVKPAEAKAERVRIMAVAGAETMKIQAEAAASHLKSSRRPRLGSPARI